MLLVDVADGVEQLVFRTERGVVRELRLEAAGELRGRIDDVGD